jgi:hypothetical protein
MRKIKAFNVDEDVYNGLLAMFKKYKIKASLSSFVNNSLEVLLHHLQEVEKLTQENRGYKVPMPFVIGEMVKTLENKKNVPPMITESDPREVYAHRLLTQWEDEYEAQKLGISIHLYSHFKDGNYDLSADKQYLIHKKTGKKYFPLPNGMGGSALGEIVEGKGSE